MKEVNDMGYSVEQFKEAVTKWEEETDLDGSLFLNVWNGAIEALPFVEGLGQLELGETWGGEGDGASIHVVIKVGDQYFQQDGYFSSWGEDEMDGEIFEVKPKQVTVTQFERV